MALRLAGIGSPEVKSGQLSQENISSSANSASFRTNVTGHSGIVTEHSGQSRKSVTFNQNRRSRSVGTTGHVQTELAVNMVRNTQNWRSMAARPKFEGIESGSDSAISTVNHMFL